MYAPRIKVALKAWATNDFLKSLLEQVENGRDLSERQVQALENIEAGIAKRTKSAGDFAPF